MINKLIDFPSEMNFESRCSVRGLHCRNLMFQEEQWREKISHIAELSLQISASKTNIEKDLASGRY